MSNVCAFENLLIVRKGKAKWGKEETEADKMYEVLYCNKE